MTTPTPHGAPELLPCPFCGSDAEFVPYKKDGLTLKCKGLGCIRRDQRTLRHSLDWLRDGMTADWNTRAAIQQAAGAVPEGKPWAKERGYHALVQVIYELQNDGSYSDDEGEETAALVDLVLRMEEADAAPTPPAVNPASDGGSSDHLVPCAGWLPIETAPDATPVWLVSEGGNIWIGERCWDGDGWMWGNCYLSIYQRADHTWASSDCEVDDDYQPVKWIPLPPPPARGNDAPTSQINPGSAPREGGHE